MARAFSLIFPDFEFNLLTNIPRKFRDNWITESFLIFGSARGQPLKNRPKHWYFDVI